jgi:hypothetical protein
MNPSFHAIARNRRAMACPLGASEVLAEPGYFLVPSPARFIAQRAMGAFSHRFAPELR